MVRASTSAFAFDTLDFFQPKNFVSVLHEPNLSEDQRLAYHVPKTLLW